MTHDCDRATELLEQVKRKRDVDAMVAALLQKNAGGVPLLSGGVSQWTTGGRGVGDFRPLAGGESPLVLGIRDSCFGRKARRGLGRA